jgi:hypothetical protein
MLGYYHRCANIKHVSIITTKLVLLIQYLTAISDKHQSWLVNSIFNDLFNGGLAIQCKPLNVITLGQVQTDTIN